MKRIKFILLAVILVSFTKAKADDGSFNLSVSSDGKLILQRTSKFTNSGAHCTQNDNFPHPLTPLGFPSSSCANISGFLK